MAQQIQLRNDSTAAWEAENPVLAQAEIGVNTTTGQFKIGNGTSTWTELDYHANASLEVPTAIKDNDGDDLIVFERGGTGVARIHAVQDDLALRSARDIILYPGDDGPGNVYINWGDATYTPDSPNRVATIGDIQQGTTGDITFDGVKIIGAGEASGDGYNNSTIQIVPDSSLYNNDQYLIIDPTNPNHIHIRPGGIQDESIAHLILGGERNNVIISDDYRSVAITARTARIENSYANSNETSNEEFIASMPVNIEVGYKVNVEDTDFEITAVTLNSPTEGLATITATGLSFVTGNTYTFFNDPAYDNFWQFTSEGVFSGPAMGGVKVPAIANSHDGDDLYVYANNADVNIQANDGAVNISAPEITLSSNAVPSSVNINTYSGAVVNSARTASYAAENKVVATLGDLPTGATGSFTSNDGKTITVTNGIITGIA